MTWTDEALLRKRRLKSDENYTKNLGLVPNKWISKVIAIIISDVEVTHLDLIDMNYIPMSRIDLNSYTNIVIAGRNTQIISDTCRTSEVSPFTPDHKSMHQVSMVYVSIRHDDEHT